MRGWVVTVSMVVPAIAVMILLSSLWVPMGAAIQPQSRAYSGWNPSTPTSTVTFLEAGLPPGTQWNVTLGGITHTSLTPTNVFLVPYGNYSYNVLTPIPGQVVISGEPPLEEYDAIPSSGVLPVNAPSVNVGVNYTTNDLLLATNATVGGSVLQGIAYYPIGSKVNITALPLPRYEFSRWVGSCYPPPPLGPCGAYSGRNNPATITVKSPTVELAFFTLLSNLTFQEHGLPSATQWGVGMNGGPPTWTQNSSLTFNEPNGTYSYQVTSPLSLPPSTRFVAIPPSGNLTINGKPVLVPVNFTEQYFLNVSTPTPQAGTVSPLSEWVNSGSSHLLTATPSAGYAFTGWTGQGSGSYSGMKNPLNLSIVGPIVEVATFGQLHRVTFNETGLPPYTPWSVSLGGSNLTSSASSIVFKMPDSVKAPYPYSIGFVAGYVPTVRVGTVSVSGNDVMVAVSFQVVTYVITLTGTGLPSKTAWSATLNGTEKTSMGGIITFMLPNGTYTISIPGVNGYSPVNSTLRITVNGNGLSESIRFTYSATGLFGVGVAYSYVILALVIVAVVVVTALWVVALWGQSRHEPFAGKNGGKKEPCQDEGEGGSDAKATGDAESEETLPIPSEE